MTDLFFLPGNHLYPTTYLEAYRHCEFVMVEDETICRRRRYHQQKIGLVLAAMREYAESLRQQGFSLHYSHLQDQRHIAAALSQLATQTQAEHLITFAIHDHSLDQLLSKVCQRANLVRQTADEDPGFMTSAAQFDAYCGDKSRLQMADFYRRQRRRLNILVQADGKPVDGQWSFDADNRKKFPARQVPPRRPTEPHCQLTQDTLLEVHTTFADYPGDARKLWLPTTRGGAEAWLQTFLEERLVGFGTYEDAICQRSETLYHSNLSALINLGLITPHEVVAATLSYAQQQRVPINDLEGFLRQIIGWREFIRGVYQRFDTRLKQENVRQQTRQLTHHWHQATTGLPPLDHAIRQQQQLGWNHHINRLMVIANLMNLCEIDPHAVYDYFMTNYIDAYDWVMTPNVFGMGLNSDSGVFASKPYLCGANYILKMSDFKRGPWCDVWDGLYWRFIDRHQTQLHPSPRMRPVLHNLNRLQPERRERIFGAAQQFLDRTTRPA